MYRIVLVGFIFLVACGGALSDEQRKRLHDGMKKNELRKISDAQITDAAFIAGRSLVTELGGLGDYSLAKSGAFERVKKVRIRLVRQNDTNIVAVEKQIVDAYAEATGQSELSDNVQKLGADSILYTKPAIKTLPDGSQKFSYMLSIHFSRKQIIMSVKD